jgi:hypothetical protein
VDQLVNSAAQLQIMHCTFPAVSCCERVGPSSATSLTWNVSKEHILTVN